MTNHRGTTRGSLPVRASTTHLQSEDIDPAILNSKVGTVFIAVINNNEDYLWVCQKHSDDGGIYAWDGVEEKDYSSIHNGNVKYRSIYRIGWQSLTIVAEPDHDLDGDDYPGSELEEFRLDAMKRWRADRAGVHLSLVDGIL